MKVEPYAGAGGIGFGASRDAVVIALGEPIREGQTGAGLTELTYSAAAYRFERGLLTEITVNAPFVLFRSVAVPFQTLSAFLSENDEEVFETVGFIVSPAFGVAFDPTFPSWVTVFPRESLAEWQSFSKR